MTAADINGVTIEYEVHGPETGEPVLLVMGLGAQLVVWPQDFIDVLVDAGHRVIAFDNRDIGRSGRIDAPAPELGTRDIILILLIAGFGFLVDVYDSVLFAVVRVSTLTGLGVPQDNVQAYAWLSVAAAGGDKDAIGNRNRIAPKMTPAQIAEAQKLAREWKSKPER